MASAAAEGGHLHSMHLDTVCIQSITLYGQNSISPCKLFIMYMNSTIQYNWHITNGTVLCNTWRGGRSTQILYLQKSSKT